MRQERGFTYLMALFALGVVALVAVKAVPLVETYEQREKEEELLRIGHEFREAIRSYYESTPGTVKRYPGRLEDLLLDRRFVGIKRHLRRIYVDPLTRKPEWGLVRNADGGIMGIHSLADGEPIKKGEFREADVALTGVTTYRNWQFVYRPQDVPVQAVRR